MEKDVAQRDGRDGSSGVDGSEQDEQDEWVVEDSRLTRDRFLYSISRDAVLG